MGRLIFVLGELCLSPVGLPLSTTLAPKARRAQVVALAQCYSEDSEPAYFGLLGGGAIALGVVMAALPRPCAS